MTFSPEESATPDVATAQKRNLHEYSFRLPTPPRIVVPPPTLTTHMPHLAIEADNAESLDLGFLSEMDLQNIVQENTLLEWAYERRRQAQMILPWLYLGPMVAAKDHTSLQREGITMALAVRSSPTSMMGAVQAAGQVCLEVASIEAPNFYHLTSKFTETSRMINTHIVRTRQSALEKTGEPTLGKVLVFCESGNEKSAAVVAAYLMETLDDFDYVKAMQVCQAQRFCVNFDDTVKNILRAYWDILMARRSVASTSALSPIPTTETNGLVSHLSTTQPVQRKRSLQQTRDDQDIDMDDEGDESDALRFVGRDVTPFQDA